MGEVPYLEQRRRLISAPKKIFVKKEENEIFIIFQFERYLFGIANYQK